jgi:hypothetical protein
VAKASFSALREHKFFSSEISNLNFHSFAEKYEGESSILRVHFHLPLTGGDKMPRKTTLFR